MPIAYLLFGYLGAGKTTLAKRLERDKRAVRFTPDDWMARLFGEDPPADIFQDRAAAIQDLMQPLWRQCLIAGADVVLDHGFWRRHERDAHDASRKKLAPCLCWWRCPAPMKRPVGGWLVETPTPTAA